MNLEINKFYIVENNNKKTLVVISPLKTNHNLMVVTVWTSIKNIVYRYLFLKGIEYKSIYTTPYNSIKPIKHVTELNEKDWVYIKPYFTNWGSTSIHR